jgi:endoglycosylceramidase
MRRLIRVGVVAVALACLASIGLVPAAAAAVNGWAGDGIVSAPGGPYLRDSLGRRLQLHGIDLAAKCGGGAVATSAPGTPCVGPAAGPRLAYVLSPGARDPGRRFTAADAATLARLGFNVVRLGIIWEGLEPGPRGVGRNDPRYCGPHRARTRFPSLGSADPYRGALVRGYLARTDRIIGLLAHAGIRVVLDMHQDAWGSVFSDRSSPAPWNGEGAPAWATCTDRRPVAPAPALWSNAYFDPAVQAAVHHFFQNNVRADLQGQFARVWAAVARHYRDDPDVLGYEAYNEPSDFVDAHFDAELQCFYGGPAHEPASCRGSGEQALRDGVIGAIQSADRHHVVFYEPSVLTDYGLPETIGIAEPLRFGRIALAFHMYGNPESQLALDARERAETRTDQPGGPPAFMDEFGASSDAAATAATVGVADGEQLSWSYWSALQAHDPTGNPFEGLLDQATRRPDRAVAEALAVPYPFATVGRPLTQSYDPATGAFSYSFAAARPARRVATEIVLPRDAYPHGYRVRVRGAVVVGSGSPARLLLVVAHRHASLVHVTVTRRR